MLRKYESHWLQQLFQNSSVARMTGRSGWRVSCNNSYPKNHRWLNENCNWLNSRGNRIKSTPSLHQQAVKTKKSSLISLIGVFHRQLVLGGPVRPLFVSQITQIDKDFADKITDYTDKWISQISLSELKFFISLDNYFLVSCVRSLSFAPLPFASWREIL